MLAILVMPAGIVGIECAGSADLLELGAPNWIKGAAGGGLERQDLTPRASEPFDRDRSVKRDIARPTGPQYRVSET